MPPKELNFITGNRNKLAEVQTILSEIVPLKSQILDLPEIQGTIEQISLDKCKRAAAIVCGRLSEMAQNSTFEPDRGLGSRTCACGRHVPLLQCFEGVTGAIYVCPF